jgi:HAAS domain-containing protein
MSDLPSADRQEFLRELRGHVLDRLEQVATPSEADCRAVLKALGSPEEIARHYRMERILERSAWKISPFSILRTVSRWMLTGIQGYLVFVIAVIGYSFALSFYVTAVLKPFFPNNVGLFVGKYGFTLARFPEPQGVDVLGFFYIPVAVVLGYLFAVGTTVLIRSLVRRLGKLKQKI